MAAAIRPAPAPDSGLPITQPEGEDHRSQEAGAEGQPALAVKEKPPVPFAGTGGASSCGLPWHALEGGRR